jgi:class 3 adenylate cyclase
MELPPDARFCMHCGQPVIVSTPSDETRLTRLAAAAPNPLAEKARAASHLPGERRVVTTLFVDVVGSTLLTEQVDVEAWTAIMNGAFDCIAPLIYRYEGTIARLLGDSLLAFYGAPVAHEDDPVRAVHTALALISVVHEYAEEIRQEYGVEFAIRVCINTGQVVVGAVQEDLKYEYTAMGGAVNLVSRIKFAARPMTVLISENTHRFISPMFECTDLGPISIKGITDPVRVYQVHGPRARPGQIRGLAGLRSPMVGRDTELAVLTQLCDAVRAGLGRAALIVGEPGLGKTRLIAEWNATISSEHAQTDTAVPSKPPLWVQGGCLSFGQGFAYHLLIDLIRSVIRIPEAAGEPKTRTALLALTEDLFGESALEVYPYLGHLLSVNLTGAALERMQLRDPQALRTGYLKAVRQLLQALSTRRPMVLVLEDLHWADPSSIGLLIELLPLVFAAPILFCLVTRPERDTPGWKLVTAAREIIGGSLTELTLNPLSETNSRKLVANILKIEALPARVRNTILKKSEGNPFFVEEVIRMLIEQGAIVQNNGDWIAGSEIGSVDIPDNLQGLLLARIDRLPDNVKHTLRVAAVIGRQFPKKVLARVLGEDGGR